FSSTNGFYTIDQQHLAQSVGLKSNTRREWDWEIIASDMRFGTDAVRNPATALPAAGGGGSGTILSLADTGWSTLDAKAIWRPQILAESRAELGSRQRVAFERFIRHGVSFSDGDRVVSGGDGGWCYFHAES